MLFRSTEIGTSSHIPIGIAVDLSAICNETSVGTNLFKSSFLYRHPHARWRRQTVVVAGNSLVVPSLNLAFLQFRQLSASAGLSSFVPVDLVAYQQHQTSPVACSLLSCPADPGSIPSAYTEATLLFLFLFLFLQTWKFQHCTRL